MNSKSNIQYKKTEIKWLPKIPDHWNTRKAKWLFTVMNRPVLSSDEVVTCFRDGTVTLRKNRRLKGFTESLKEIGYQGIKKGDLVIHVMDAFAGAIGVSDSDGKATPVYLVCRPKLNLNTHYYAYIVREMARTGYITCLAKGIRERSTDFRFETFSAQFLPLPSIEEQNAIASFIDWKTKKINKYIQKKKRLIALLKEQKQAIISQAVTRGLDPNVRLRPSGVEWLGDIPNQWKIQRLKFCVKRKLQYGANEPSGQKNGTWPRYIRITDITSSGDLRTETLCNLQPEVAAPYLLEEGDILFARSGATVGKTFCYQKEWGNAAFAGYLIKARINENIISHKFVYYFSKSYAFDQWIINNFSKSTIQNISAEKYASLQIPIPSKTEQYKIIAYIHNKTHTIDTSIAQIEQQLKLIQEYRARLISDVVTGKIDIRNVEIEEIKDEETHDPSVEIDELDEESLDLIGVGIEDD